MIAYRIFAVSFLLASCASAAHAQVTFAQRTVDNFPYFAEAANMKCEPAPKRNATDVVKLAEEAGLWKPSGGAWIVHYAKKSDWREDPFADNCVWVVTSSAQPGLSGTAGEFTFYLQDQTERFMLDPPLSAKGKFGALLAEINAKNKGRDEHIANESTGIVVLSINHESAAAKAGLAKWDIITSFDGKPVTTKPEIIQLLSAVPAGKQVPVHIKRGGVEMDMKIQF